MAYWSEPLSTDAPWIWVEHPSANVKVDSVQMKHPWDTALE